MAASGSRSTAFEIANPSTALTELSSQAPGSTASKAALRAGASSADTVGDRNRETSLGNTTTANGGKPSSVDSSNEKGRRCGRIIENLSQQKLRAWQPVLTPKWIIIIFSVTGMLFLGLGVLLLLTSDSVIECQIEYGDPVNACEDVATCTTPIVATIESGDCAGLGGKSEIAPPVFLYYRLTSYYQNHRRYVKSRDDGQLRGEVLEASELSSCEPLIKGADGRVLHPCGLIAWSVFNDTFTLKSGASTSYAMDESASTIAWKGDLDLFKNPSPAPDPSTYDEWLNESLFPSKIENAHFIVWMRVAAMPDFRKLYGRIDTPVKLPVEVEVSSRYPVDDFGGKKYVVLSQTSWLGGRNSFLGISYLVIGSLCVVFGIFFVVKNYQKPRLMGDVRHLNWIFNKRRNAKHNG